MAVISLNCKWLRENSDAYDFCNNLSVPQKRSKLNTIENSISVVGAATQIKMLESNEIITQFNLQGTNIFSFKKLLKNKILYTCELAQKDKKMSHIL